MTRPLPPLLLMLFVATAILPPGAAGEQARGGVDLAVTIVYPVDGGKYLSQEGVRIRAVVSNEGTEWYNSSLQLTAEIVDTNSGIRKFTDNKMIPLNLSPGGSVEVSFSNWSYAIPGNYSASVTINPLGDTNHSNDVSTVRFDLWTNTWPYPIQLKGGFVSPTRGTTQTVFTYRVDYVYPLPPDNVSVIIDGVPHAMLEEDPGDHQFMDGKSYYYATTLPVGPHNYTFYASSGEKNTSLLVIEGRPWVNLTLSDPNVTPTGGYVTTRYHFTVRYGSYFSKPPSEIVLHLMNRTFEMLQTNPDDENYASGNKQYYATVPGWVVGPGPWEWYVEVRCDKDVLRTSTLTLEGPSGVEGTLTGVVHSDAGGEVPELKITILPLNLTYSFEGARYTLDLYEGRNYTVVFSSPGHFTRSVEGVDLNGDEVKYLNVTLLHTPRPATLKGVVRSSAGYVPEGIHLVLYSGTEPLMEEWPGADGRYAFQNVTPRGLYRLYVEAPYHQNVTIPLQLGEGEVYTLNVTLKEWPPPFNLTGKTAPVEGPIKIDFQRVPALTTVKISLKNLTGELQYTLSLEGSTLLIHPTGGLMYGESYTITLFKGCTDVEGKVLLWRNFTVEVQAERERSTHIEIKPAPGTENLPVEGSFEISFGIHINITTLNVTLREVGGGEVPLGLMYAWGVDWERHGATWGVLKVTPKRVLSYSSAYILIIAGGLRDHYGNTILESEMRALYSTVQEPDSDGDGVPDSSDAFPFDPTEWKDTDGDGVPDGKDRFPQDPRYSSDMDGDGVPDEVDPDADGDGIPDSWERRYGLDPTTDDSGADPDGDGYTNLEEYKAGTDPLSEASNPGEREKRIFEASLLAAVVLLMAFLIFYLIYGGGGREGRREMRKVQTDSRGMIELDEELEEFLEE